MLGLIKRTFGYRCPLKTKLILYNSIVRTPLTYGSIIWSYGSKKNLKRVEAVQRRATKYICNDYVSDYKIRLLKCKLLPFSYTKEVLDVSFLYKCLHNYYDINIYSFLSFHDPTTSRTRLGQRPFTIKTQPGSQPKIKDFYTKRIVKTWNALPDDIVNLIPTNNLIIPFKKKVKEYYHSKLVSEFNTFDLCTWRTFYPCGRC